MTEEHERQAEAAERELADLKERSERVGEQIDTTRKDWDAKVAPTHPCPAPAATRTAPRRAAATPRRRISRRAPRGRATAAS
jgi:hypothetical protein